MKKVLSVMLALTVTVSLLTAGAQAGEEAQEETPVDITIPVLAEPGEEEEAAAPVEEAEETAEELTVEEPVEETDAVLDGGPGGMMPGGPGGGPSGGGGGNQTYELLQSCWNSSGYVGWTHFNNDDSSADHSGTIASITLGGYTLSYFNNPSQNNLKNSSSRVALADCYPGVTTTVGDTRELVITPVPGHYVTRVVVACCGSGGDPFQCGTWNADMAYDDTFTMQEDRLVIPLGSECFGHTSKNECYFIIIETQETPNPLYIQYWPGDMEGLLDGGWLQQGVPETCYADGDTEHQAVGTRHTIA